MITNSPNNNAAGRAGFTRLSNPTFQDLPGRSSPPGTCSRSMSPTPRSTRTSGSTLEVGFFSDRNFLEQYFKRRFDTGLDQENLAYLIRQKQNRAVTLLAETNLQTFNTETQWYPKGDYYRLGDSLLGNRLTYFQHTGADYANVHTAAEVNNRTIFAFLPIDPISNTNGTFQSGRLYTAHELDLPLNFSFVRVTPYVQGQAVGWNNQIGGHAVGRIWGAVGARADVTLWKAFPNVESELLNVHGLNHKIDFVADARDAYSNVPLNSIGVQDDLDDNTYEYTRRYFALTNYVGGILPAAVRPPVPDPPPGALADHRDHRHPGHDRDLKLGIHQRLQTKRGPGGAAAHHRLHGLRPRHDLLPRGQPRQLRQAVRPELLQLRVVHRRPDQHRLLRLVRVLQGRRRPLPQLQHVARQERPVRAPDHHLGPLDHADPQGEHLHRLHGRQHRADQHLGPEHASTATG